MRTAFFFALLSSASGAPRDGHPTGPGHRIHHIRRERANERRRRLEQREHVAKVQDYLASPEAAAQHTKLLDEVKKMNVSERIAAALVKVIEETESHEVHAEFGRRLSAAPGAPPPISPPTPPPSFPHAWDAAELGYLDTHFSDAAGSKGGTLQYMIDTVWIITAALLCFFLQAGFGLLEAGALRAKNAKNIMLKNLMDACIGGLVYYCFGYAICYGGASRPDGIDGNAFSGGGLFKSTEGHDGIWFGVDVGMDTGGWFRTTSNYWMLIDVEEDEYYIFLFQYVFAATIATIVSGAVAERIQFRGYLIYSFFLTGFIYPFAAHWTWDPNGFINSWGICDYAGGNAVHALSGCAAWMGAKALGPRIGRFVEGTSKSLVTVNFKPVELAQHNVPMMCLGLFILWLGFIPFIGGSACYVNFQLGRLCVMTTLSGCSGGCVALAWGYMTEKHASLEQAMTGVLAAMVGICSSCGCTTIWAAFWIIAPISVLAYRFGLWFNIYFCGKFLGGPVDDPLGASALHYWPGVWSMIACGLLSDPDIWDATYGIEFSGRTTKVEDLTLDDFSGIFYGGNGMQLAYQLLSVVVITLYGLASCFLLFYGMKLCGTLRVPEADELEGLDATHHGGLAYTDTDVHIVPAGLRLRKKKADMDATKDGTESPEGTESHEA